MVWFGFLCSCFQLLDFESKDNATNDSTRIGRNLCSRRDIQQFFDLAHLLAREPHFL